VTNEATSVISNVVATNETEADDAIAVYPNPARDFLTIVGNIKYIKAYIYDLSGKLLRAHGVSNNILDIKELSVGTYLLKLYSKEKVYQTKVVIVR
jgi:myo-inositol-hexaphosphate 3-phosphohydrolase